MEKQPTTGKLSHVKHRIKVQQYGTHLDVFFCSSMFETAQKLIPGEMTQEEADGCAALFLMRDHPRKKGVVEFLILLNALDLHANDIAHEAMHFVSSFMNHVGVLHDPNNDEPFAYLIGYVVGKIHECATKSAIVIKSK